MKIVKHKTGKQQIIIAMENVGKKKTQVIRVTTIMKLEKRKV